MTESLKFTIFFIMWIVIFAVIYQIIGVNIGIDYSSKSFKEAFSYYLIFSWNNSVSNPDEPQISFWSMIEESDTATTSSLMQSLVYLVWIINQYILLIILLNLLISIMSHNYENYMSNQSLYTYQQKALMNTECRLVLRSFNIIQPHMDCAIITQLDKAEDNEREISSKGFVKTIKDFIIQTQTKENIKG